MAHFHIQELKLSDLRPSEAHVVAHDVELCHSVRLYALDEMRHEEVWVVELAVHVHRQCKGQVVGVTIAIQDVEDGAAGRLVRFQKDDMVLRVTRTILDTGQKARRLFSIMILTR